MTPELEASPEAHKTGHRWVDLSVAGCALLVSFCSLGLAIHHGHTMERLVTANSQPFLQFNTSNLEPGPDGTLRTVMTIDVTNGGAGPARVEWLKTSMDDQSFDTWRQFLERSRDAAVSAGKVDPAATFESFSTATAPFLIKANDTVAMIRWERQTQNTSLWECVDKIRADSKRLQLQACYCSIFDECWIADSRVFKPKQVDHC